MTAKWDFWIDRGGTFTDIVARTPKGDLLAHKLLSENPDHYPDAALHGIRELMGIAGDAQIPAAQIATVKMVPRWQPMRCWNVKAYPLC